MRRNLIVFGVVLALFAAVISGGVMYNSGRIAFAERQRDLATMRVLGMTRTEVTKLFLGELLLQLIASLPVGLALGYGLSVAAARAMSTELFRMPMVVSRGTVLFAVWVTAATAVLVALVLRRRIAGLDVIAVLKSRE